MVMVVLVQSVYRLVAGAVARQHDFLDFDFIEQQLDVAVDGRDAGIGAGLAHPFQYFRWRQGACRGNDDLADCSALAG